MASWLNSELTRAKNIIWKLFWISFCKFWLSISFLSEMAVEARLQLLPVS